MKRVCIVFLCFLLCASCKTTLTMQNYHELLRGSWERIDDASAGDVVRIVQRHKDEAPVGILEKVSPHSRQFGYVNGDVKWRFIQLDSQPDTVIIENLNITITKDKNTDHILQTSKTYSQFRMQYQYKDILILVAADNGPAMRIGNIQIWKRIKSHATF